ncbi:PREDICTED: TAB2 homolog chloroplastic [Prunus dulcis]|uniref:PREDICTED: TAB2 homolog chloroplastic n=1 Tax=Prunus dulcis TaxID=3755 RepID=A0A5E4G9Q6_PRUDU|nr:PREDICTED: TAB2 homolog chloroplastic [Prunus dulcis]
MELPENLLGEKWAFVQLPFSTVQEEISSSDSNLVFGVSLDLDLLGIEIDDKILILGLAVASSRAKPLAAWMNGLEVCSIEADLSQARLAFLGDIFVLPTTKLLKQQVKLKLRKQQRRIVEVYTSLQSRVTWFRMIVLDFGFY